MPPSIKDIGKKDLKEYINKNGGFLPATIEKLEKNFPKAAETKIRERFAGDEKRITDILENAVYVKAISSNGDLNRNGYIIRENAWKPAIENYLENPVFLLQHDDKEIIGETFAAKVTKNGLESEMFVFPDQMTEANVKRFDRGQLKAISTGHITNAVEWENEDTKEILSTEEFRELDFEERFFGAWIMAVTALEWVEQSLVTIPSNRASFITKKDQTLKYCLNTLGEEIPEDIKLRVNSDEEPTKKDLKEIETETPAEETPEDGETLQKEVEEAAGEVKDENDTKPEEETVETETIEEETEETETTETTETPAEGDDAPAEETETTESVETTEPKVESTENADDGETPKSEEAPEKGEETETTEEPETPAENAIETEEKPERPALKETLHKFRNGMTAKIRNHNGTETKPETPAEEIEEEAPAEEETPAKENAVKAESSKTFEINIDSIEEVFVSLEENGFKEAAVFMRNEFETLQTEKNAIAKERDDFKNVVKNSPLRRKLSTVGQPGITTPTTSLNGEAVGKEKTTDSKTLGDVLENKGVVINYKSKHAGRITTHKA